jgi:tight adherence protein B
MDSDPSSALLLLAGILVVAFAGLCLYVGGAGRRAALAERSSMGPADPPLARLARLVEARLLHTRPGQRLDAFVSSAAVPVTPLGFLAMVVGGFAAGCAIGFVFLSTIVGLALGAGAAGACFAWIARQRGRRRLEFVAQLPEIARVLSNGASAGLSLAAAIEVASEDLDEPAKAELHLIVQELRVGRSLDEALERLKQRLPSRQVAVLMSTLIIQQRAGGDTVQALQELSETLEGRKDTLREVRTLMAGAVFSSYIVLGLGVGVILLMNAVNPGVLGQLTSEPLGLAALTVSSLLYAVGLTSIRKITKVDV